MADLRPHTKEYSQKARDDLGVAVTRAREAAGYTQRQLANLAKIGKTSLYKLESGIPVGSTAEPREQVREQQPAAQAAPPDLLDKINYLRRKLGKEDFHLMWDVFTEINESNARFEEAEAAKARADEEVRPTDNPARVAG